MISSFQEAPYGFGHGISSHHSTSMPFVSQYLYCIYIRDHDHNCSILAYIYIYISSCIIVNGMNVIKRDGDTILPPVDDTHVLRAASMCKDQTKAHGKRTKDVWPSRLMKVMRDLFMVGLIRCIS